MKKQAYMIATIIMLITFAGLSTAKAQTSGATQLTADIPFEFNVGDQTMPAGAYTVRCTNPASDLKVLQLRSSDGRASAMVRTNSVIGKTLANSKLVFNRYGDHYFLAQAWLPSDSIGMRAPKSRKENRIARELAPDKHGREEVALSVKR